MTHPEWIERIRTEERVRTERQTEREAERLRSYAEAETDRLKRDREMHLQVLEAFGNRK